MDSKNTPGPKREGFWKKLGNATIEFIAQLVYGAGPR